RVRGGRANGAPRTHHRQRRDRGQGAGRECATPRVRTPPRRARRGMNEPAREPACATPDRLATLVDAAIEARAGLRGRALGDTAASLGEAAARWAADARLREELPAAARLSAPSSPKRFA